MRIDRLVRTMAPLAGIVAAASLAGCGWNGTAGGEGVPLAELDVSGPAPTSVALLGPDTVEISDGTAFTVEVDGEPEAAGRMRFTLKDGALAILRERGEWDDDAVATVRVTMPAPAALVLAGSGRMSVERLAGNATVNVTGSGTLETGVVDVESLDAVLTGSGTYRAAGRAENLDLTIAGSGSGAMAGLRAGRADITIAGSGNAVFASDGIVDANILGSGRVTVRGSARCTVSSVGPGKLVCERDAEPAA